MALVTTPLSSPARDGVSSFAESTIRSLERCGVELVFVVLDDGNAAAIEQMTLAYESAGLELVGLPIRGGRVSHRLLRRLVSLVAFVPPAQAPYVASARRVRRRLAEIAPHAVVALGGSPGLTISASPPAAILQFSLPAVDARLIKNGPWRRLLAVAWQRRLAAHAQILLVTTSSDVNFIAQAFSGADVRRMPLAVEPFLSTQAEGARDRLLLVGDFNYPPNSEAGRFFLDEVVPRFFDKVPEAEIVIAGKKSQSLGVPRDARVHLAGEYEVLHELGTTRTVGVLPLFAAGGLRTRVLEYAAANIPLVATPASVEGLPLAALAGVTICSHHDLADTCARLVGAPEEMQRLRTAGTSALAEVAARAEAVAAWDDVITRLIDP